MGKKIQRKLNFLTAYAVISTFVFGMILFTDFSCSGIIENVDEINVKKINIISEEGDLRMVLSNETRQHPGRINGEDLDKRERPAGLLFFNDEGDECGGIVYYGKTENGVTNSGMSFSMDQYKEDQVIQILNSENYENGQEKIKRGIIISDLPAGSDLLTRMDKIREMEMKTMSEEEKNKIISEVGNSLSNKQRVFIGKTNNNNSGLYLSGPDGKQKMKIYVDENGIPKIDITDENGVTSNILQKD